jgi:hypothetical protein
MSQGILEMVTKILNGLKIKWETIESTIVKNISLQKKKFYTAPMSHIYHEKQSQYNKIGSKVFCINAFV